MEEVLNNNKKFSAIMRRGSRLPVATAILLILTGAAVLILGRVYRFEYLFPRLPSIALIAAGAMVFICRKRAELFWVSIIILTAAMTFYLNSKFGWLSIIAALLLLLSTVGWRHTGVLGSLPRFLRIPALNIASALLAILCILTIAGESMSDHMRYLGIAAHTGAVFMLLDLFPLISLLLINFSIEPRELSENDVWYTHEKSAALNGDALLDADAADVTAESYAHERREPEESAAVIVEKADSQPVSSAETVISTYASPVPVVPVFDHADAAVTMTEAAAFMAEAAAPPHERVVSPVDAAPVFAKPKSRKWKISAIVCAGAILIAALIFLIPKIIDTLVPASRAPSAEIGRRDGGDQPGGDESNDTAAVVSPPDSGSQSGESPGAGAVESSGSTDPVLPDPTLPAPTNLRWGRHQNWPSEICLLWDWTPPAGEFADDYRYGIDCSINGGEWHSRWGYTQPRILPLDVILSTGSFSGGEIRFRVTVWKGADSRNIEAVSETVELGDTITVTISSQMLNATEAVFGLGGDDGNILIISSGDLIAENGKPYFYSARSAERTWAGSTGGSAVNDGRIDFNVRNSDFSVPGITVQLWDITDQSMAGGLPSITVRASNAVPVTAETGGAAIPRQPQVSNVRFAQDQWGVLAFAFDIPAELRNDNNSSNNNLPFRVEYRRNGGEYEYFDLWIWDEYLRLYELDEPGTYTDFRIISRSASRHPLRDSLPVSFDGTVIVQESGQPLPFSTADITSEVDGNQTLLMTVHNVHLINPGRMSIVNIYADFTNSGERSTWNPVPQASQMVSVGIGGSDRIHGSARATFRDYGARIDGDTATVTLSPKQIPAVVVPEPAETGGNGGAIARSAPENVRLEVTGGGGGISLFWDAPSWATDDTVALIEAKLSISSEWTLVNRVPVNSDTRREVSSLVLHWSSPRSNDPYEFRIRFGERDSSVQSGYANYTDYTLCPGTLTFTVGQPPLTVTARYGNNTLTVAGAFEGNRVYFFVFDTHTNANNNYRSWIGFSAPTAERSHEFDNQPYVLAGGNLYAWELSGASMSGNNANVNVSAMPAPVVIMT